MGEVKREKNREYWESLAASFFFFSFLGLAQEIAHRS